MTLIMHTNICHARLDPRLPLLLMYVEKIRETKDEAIIYLPPAKECITEESIKCVNAKSMQKAMRLECCIHAVYTNTLGNCN